MVKISKLFKREREINNTKSIIFDKNGNSSLTYSFDFRSNTLYIHLYKVTPREEQMWAQFKDDVECIVFSKEVAKCAYMKFSNYPNLKKICAENYLEFSANAFEHCNKLHSVINGQVA